MVCSSRLRLFPSAGTDQQVVRDRRPLTAAPCPGEAMRMVRRVILMRAPAGAPSGEIFA
jgi:hypothetical protein